VQENEENFRYKIDSNAPTLRAGRRSKEGKIVQKTGDGLGVAKLSAANHLSQLRVAKSTRSNFFVFLRPRISTGKVLSEENIHSFLKKSWRRENVQEDAVAFGTIAGFLEELARGGPAGIFAPLDAAGDEFPEELARGMAVLPNEEDAAA
jgi:hypothetical protein